MRFSTAVKSISQLETHAADILSGLAGSREPLVITQDGEARAVLMDIAAYEELQGTLALLERMVLGNRDIDAGRTQPVKEVVRALRSRPAHT